MEHPVAAPSLPPIEEHHVLQLETADPEEEEEDDVDSQGSFDEKASLVRSGHLSFSYTQSITKYQSTHEQDPRSAETSGIEADKVNDGQLSSIMTDFQASFFLPSLLISSYSTVRQSYDKMARSMAQSMAKRSICTSRSFAYSIIEKMSDDRGASFGLTMFNILPALLGSALFTIPYAISIGGYSTIPIFILIAMFADFTCLLLADCMYEVSPRSRRLKRTKLDYVEIAEAAFGRHAARLINFTLVFYLFASNIVVLVLIGKSFYSILSRYTDLSLNAMMAIFSILVLPTLFIQRLSHLAYLSLISTLAIIVGSIATMAIFIVKNKSWRTNSGAVPDFNWEGFALALGMWSYTVVPHTIIPQVEACMRQPEKFRKAVHLSFGISTPIKIIFSVIGALTYGSSTQALVTKNVVVSSYPVSVLANAVICVYAVCNFPLNFFVVCDAFDSVTLGAKHINLKKGGKFHPLWILLTRPVLVGIGLGIGMVVPYFGLLVGILGSFLGTLLVFVFPCVFHLKLKWKKQSLLWNMLEIVVLFIGSAVGVIGLYASVKGLYLAISGKNST